jgi:hypothetical protein
MSSIQSQPHLTHASPSHSYPYCYTPNKTSQDVHVPPAKIATPAFGSDVAARFDRATLRAAVLQAPDVTSKMSTTLEKVPAAHGIRQAHAIDTITAPPHSRIPLTLIPILLHTKQNNTRRTPATSEDRDSRIRQRRGCKQTPSLAESCGAPSSRRNVEDVNNTGEAIFRCTRHQTSTRHRYDNNPPLAHPPHTHTHTATHQTKHHKTYIGHQRRSRLRHSAAT